MKKRLFGMIATLLALALLCGGALAEVRTLANVWMRAEPNINSDPVTSLPEGKSLEYLGETADDDRGIGIVWYKVKSGEYTGWVSSRYTELVGEDAAGTPAPEADTTPAPEAPTGNEPEAEPTEEAPLSLPALIAGKLLSDATEGDATDGEDAPEAPSAQAPAQVVELSGYYLDDLVDAANAIGLIPYRQVESEAPFQYYNESLILAGNQRVENIVIYGAGYEVFGVGVGTDANTARAFLNAAGLDYTDSANGITFEHRATESSLFKDANGHDSCINLWLDENDIVTEIDWSSYTG